MIDYRSRVEYVGEAVPNEGTAYLKGKRGIVTAHLYNLDDDDCYAEVTFMEDGGTRTLNVKNLKEIPNV